jgi:hypothetical protein
MSSPASLHHEHREALAQLGRALAAVLASAAERASTNDTADYRRPLGAGDQPVQHEDRTTRPRNLGAAFEEDDRSDRVTSTDKH